MYKNEKSSDYHKSSYIFLECYYSVNLCRITDWIKGSLGNKARFLESVEWKEINDSFELSSVTHGPWCVCLPFILHTHTHTKLRFSGFFLSFFFKLVILHINHSSPSLPSSHSPHLLLTPPSSSTNQRW